MKELPYLQQPPDKLLASTGHLSTVAMGAYMRIYFKLCLHGGRLPHDDRALAHISGLSLKAWRSVAATVTANFDVAGGVLSHPFVIQQFRKVEAQHELRSSAGERGGRAKALKTKEPGLASASVVPGESRIQNPEHRKESSEQGSEPKKIGDPTPTHRPEAASSSTAVAGSDHEPSPPKPPERAPVQARRRKHAGPAPGQRELFGPLPIDPEAAPSPAAGSRTVAGNGAAGACVERGMRLPPDWKPSDVDVQAALREGLSIGDVHREEERFRNYWLSLAGARARKASWPRTWKNWVMEAADRKQRNADRMGRGGHNGYADISRELRRRRQGDSEP